MMHAWISTKQAKVAGIVIWEDENGNWVYASMVTATDKHNTNFDDMTYLGPVTHFVTRATEGEFKYRSDEFGYIG